MMNAAIRLITEPQPIRKIARVLMRNLRLGSDQFRFKVGAIERPNYAFLVYQAAQLAHKLGHKSVSVLEFGVAGGGGLLMLERHANWVERIFPIKVEIYGFDTGEGLPPPQDYRDLPYHWQQGFYRMDQQKLKERLTRSTLVLGDVRETAGSFFEKYNPAPIGAISQDMDYYSSTVASFGVMARPERMLPRVFCYFDDVVGDEIAQCDDYTGQRLAIREFNAQSEDQKLSPAHHLRITASAMWHHQIWYLHNYAHPKYGQFVSREDQQIPI
jgi:hypothetical protein